MRARCSSSMRELSTIDVFLAAIPSVLAHISFRGSQAQIALYLQTSLTARLFVYNVPAPRHCAH